ncbi:MAG TPA: ABC transporter permease [Flavitalea sp.]|nr:ABC transporter permease [Flavitalea sp.]
MKFWDTLRIAFKTVRSNKLRTGITVAIIAFGIMALVGIRTAIEAMQQKFIESFSSMGATGFTIRFVERNFGFNREELKKEKKGAKRQKKSNFDKPITKIQAETFKNSFQYPAKVSLNIFGTGDAVVSYRNKKSTPSVRVFGGDENYLDQNGRNLIYGRNLNSLDVESGRNVAIIGSDVARRFFGQNLERPLDQIIRVNSIPYRVVGVLEEKGSTMGMNRDNVIITTYSSVRRFFNNDPRASFNIQIKVADLKLLDAAIGQSTGLFRSIRRLSTTEEDNFVVDKSDSFVEMLLNQLSYLTGAAIIIGFITLVGAAIGLMNIMLVAVTERTKEIGLVKAIGGRQRNVRQQFLFEAILISLIGALFGVILGVIVGNSFSLVLNTGFVVPWNWMILGIVICSIVGLLAGLYPAFKASRLNPIEALRYE